MTSILLSLTSSLRPPTINTAPVAADIPPDRVNVDPGGKAPSVRTRGRNVECNKANIATDSSHKIFGSFRRHLVAAVIDNIASAVGLTMVRVENLNEGRGSEGQRLPIRRVDVYHCTCPVSQNARTPPYV